MKSPLAGLWIFAAGIVLAAGGLEAGSSNPETPRGFATALLPARRVIISARVDSTVAKHIFKEGESFDKGDLLVKLDSKIYEQLFKRAKAEHEYYKKEAARNKSLLADSAVGEAEYAKSVLMRDSSAANLEMAKTNLERCVVRAPFAGRVAKRVAEEFEFVKTSQPLLEIIDDRTLLAVVHLPASMKNEIHIGSKAFVKLDSTGKKVAGEVREISAEIDPASRSFTVRIAIDNKKAELVPGMSGTAFFTQKQKPDIEKKAKSAIETLKSIVDPKTYQ